MLKASNKKPRELLAFCKMVDRNEKIFGSLSNSVDEEF